jgi:hypothetical protein
MREAIIDANVALGEPDHLMREAIRGHQLGPSDAYQDAIKELRRHLMRGVISANHRPSDAIKTQSRSLGGT